MLIKNLKSSSGSTTTEWEELLPQLQMIKNTSKIKKDKLYKVAKIVKYLLTEEKENKEATEDVKKEPELPELPEIDIDSIVEERLQPIKEVVENQSYMLDTVKENDTTVKNTTDFSEVFKKIAKALTKLKDQCEKEKTPTMMPIFRPTNGGRSDFTPPIETSQFDSPKPRTYFDIPCQRASDILGETANIPLPKEMFCDKPNVNLKSLAKNTKLNLDNLPFKNIVPNSVSVVDSDDSVAILFKPKNVSFMQMYGNLLKKITITVLVPYYVSKLAI
ncbi:uncharacterized protein LOC113504173 [Trichoplusia ni]|uniref:Uncharacterized protein LOC113504173 n=1 Tax=Trichoplusia ni TaxID=7111 RepID=A0A7E5WPR6_TRINI|nr:uncharacterized protein LOC113504173 [Trichoplusia ni]